MGVQGVCDGFYRGLEMDAFSLLAPFAVGDRFAGGVARDGVDSDKPFSVVPPESKVHEAVERCAAD